MKTTLLICAASVASVFAGSAPVQITFNTNTPGALVGQTGSSSEGLSSEWLGSATLVVADGDLSSPHAIAQTGTPQKTQGAGRDHGNSAAGILFASPVRETVYFSFLAEVPHPACRAGIVFGPLPAADANPASASFTYGIMVTSEALAFFKKGGLPIADVPFREIADVHFVVGRIDFQASGEYDRLQIWIDPDLGSGSPGPADVDTSDFNLGSELPGVSLFAYHNAAPTWAIPSIDNIRFGPTLDSVAAVQPAR
jgi:hypothetical protein